MFTNNINGGMKCARSANDIQNFNSYNQFLRQTNRFFDFITSNML